MSKVIADNPFSKQHLYLHLDIISGLQGTTCVLVELQFQQLTNCALQRILVEMKIYLPLSFRDAEIRPTLRVKRVVAQRHSPNDLYLALPLIQQHIAGNPPPCPVCILFDFGSPW